MMAFICIFFPALIAVSILGKLQNNTKINLEYIIINYIIFELLIILIIEIVLTLFFNLGEYILNSNSFTNIFTIKYLILSLVLACILPFIYEIFRKNILININFKKNELAGSKENEKRK